MCEQSLNVSLFGTESCHLKNNAHFKMSEAGWLGWVGPRKRGCGEGVAFSPSMLRTLAAYLERDFGRSWRGIQSRSVPNISIFYASIVMCLTVTKALGCWHVLLDNCEGISTLALSPCNTNLVKRGQYCAALLLIMQGNSIGMCVFVFTMVWTFPNMRKWTCSVRKP